ncbi:MAG: hypothetical protein AABX54_02390 [Nanoarchaeota archaeon]
MTHNPQIEQTRKTLQEYIKSQGISFSNVELCLDAVNLLINWRVPPSVFEDLQRGQAYVAYSFGIGKRKDRKKEIKDPREILYSPAVYYPGLSNEDFAKIIADLYQQGLEKPIFTQWEIAIALERNHGIRVPEIQIAKPKESYLSIQGSVRQFLEAGLQKYNKILFLNHPISLARAKAITCSEINSQRGKPLEEILVVDTSKVRYDPESVQPWTRDERSILENEFASRFHHVFHLKSINADSF